MNRIIVILLERAVSDKILFTKRILISCFVGLCFMAFSLTAVDNISAADVAGHLKKVESPAYLVRAGKTMDAEPGQQLFAKDILKTGAAGSMGMMFSDDTMVSIGPKTEYEVQEYVFKPQEKKMSFVSKISKGTLQFVSGSMTSLAPGSVAVKSPAGTIGLRGTRILVKVE